MDISELILTHIQKADKLVDKAAKETDVSKMTALRELAEVQVQIASVLSHTQYPPRSPEPDVDTEPEPAQAEQVRTDTPVVDAVLEGVLDFLIEASRLRRR